MILLLRTRAENGNIRHVTELLKIFAKHVTERPKPLGKISSSLAGGRWATKRTT